MATLRVKARTKPAPVKIKQVAGTVPGGNSPTATGAARKAAGAAQVPDGSLREYRRRAH